MLVCLHTILICSQEINTTFARNTYNVHKKVAALNPSSARNVSCVCRAASPFSANAFSTHTLAQHRIVDTKWVRWQLSVMHQTRGHQSTCANYQQDIVPSCDLVFCAHVPTILWPQYIFFLQCYYLRLRTCQPHYMLPQHPSNLVTVDLAVFPGQCWT